MARQIVKKGLTAAEHAALDHSEIPGAGGEETFTQEVHDLEDHSSVPGVPSIEGLLDETSHDALDHTGLTGVGGTSNFKDSFATEAELPSTSPTDLTGVSSRALTTGSSTFGGTKTSLTNERAVRLIAPGPVNTFVVTGRIDGDTGQTPNWQIWDNLGEMGVPGTKLYNSNGPNLVSTGWQTTTYTFEFDPPLPAGTYWLALAPTSGEEFRLNLDGNAVGEAYVACNAGNWSQWGIREGQTLSYMASSLLDVDYEDGEIAFTQDTNKLHRYVSATDSWIELNPDEVFDSDAHEAVDHSGLTGIPAAEVFTEEVHAETSHEGIAGDLQWKAPVDDEASLPVNTPSTIHNFNLEPLSFLEHVDPGEPGTWDSFIANGFGTYSVVIMLNLFKKGKLRATIHADNDGVIGDLIATSLEEPYFNYPNPINEEVTFNFGDLELINGEQYWVKIISVVYTGYELKIRGCTVADIAESFYINNTRQDEYALCMDVISTVTLSYEADARYAKSEKTVNVFDGTTWNQVGLDETSHDLLDHTGLTGVGSVANSWTSENNTVTASSEKDINITVESALVTRLLVSAIDGNATPDMDYDIEIYEDESMTTKAYIARGITDVEYEDKIPWEWFGGTTMYIKVINNKAADITDLDITINYRR